MEIKRQELELERDRRLVELAARKVLQEMEAELAEAKLFEQLEIDCDDQCSSSDDGNEEQNLIMEQREAERREAERREAERREADLCEAGRRDAERREAERREPDLRDAERRQAERRETDLREAERRDAEGREAERREAERRESQRREAELHDSDRCNVNRREQGYNEVELCNTRHGNKRSKENALSAEQQSRTLYRPPVDAFIPQRSPQTPSYPRQPFVTAQGDSSDQLQGEDRRAHYVSQQHDVIKYWVNDQQGVCHA